LDDNLGLEGCTTGSNRGRGAKTTGPPDDVPQALACTSASDLDIGKERCELFLELRQFLKTKGEGTQNTMRDWVLSIQSRRSINQGNGDVIWYDS